MAIGRTNRASNRVSMMGMASGLDTQSIVEASMSGEKEKINKLLRKQKLLEWKTESYRDMSSLLKALQDEFMDSLKQQTNMRSQSNYKVYKTSTTISNGDTSQLISAKGTSEGSAGNHTVSVIQKAEYATLITNKISKSITTGSIPYMAKKCAELSTTPDSNGKMPAQSFNVVIDGVGKTISIDNNILKGLTIPDGTGYKLDNPRFEAEIENAISKEFGKGKVSVKFNGTNFSIDTTSNGGASKITISGAEFLDLSASSSNRINIESSLTQFISSSGGGFGQNWIPSTSATGTIYSMSINGKSFEFSGDTKLSDVMKKISSNSDVLMSYDESSDNIIFKTRNSGATQKVEIAGVNYTAKQYVSGKDAKAIVDGVLVTRASNEFTVNGVNYNILRNPSSSEQLTASFKDINGNNVYMPMDSTEFDLLSPQPSGVLVRTSEGRPITKPIDYIDFDADTNPNKWTDYTVWNSSNTQITQADYNAMTTAQKNACSFKKNGVVVTQQVTPNDYARKLNAHEKDISQLRFIDNTGNTIKSSTVIVDDQEKYDKLNNSEMGEIDLKYTANPSSEAKVELTIDDDKVYDNIKTFIEQYNNIVKKMNSLVTEKYDRNYPPLTDEEKEAMTEDQVKLYEAKAKKGILRRDDALNGILSQMRMSMYNSIEGVTGGIYSIGISTTSKVEDNGILEIDSVALKAAIRNDPDQVMNIFCKSSNISYDRNASAEQRTARNNEQGIVNRLYDIIRDSTATTKDKTGSFGTLVQKAGLKDTTSETENELYKQMYSYEKLIENMWDRYYQKEDALYKKYANLETMMSKLNNQTNSLKSMMG